MSRESTLLLVSLIGATAWMLYDVLWRQPRLHRARLLQSLEAFSRAIELRFPSREGLNDRIVEIALQVAKGLSLGREVEERLATSARLCEIGLCAVPYRQLNGGERESWGNDQIERFRKHPEVGAAMIELVPSIERLAPIVRYSQVDYDAGEDRGLPSRDALPIESRILRVACDTAWFERAMGPVLARERLLDGRGTAYEPAIVDVLIPMLTLTRAGDHVQTCVA